MSTTANRPRIGIGTAEITQEDRERVQHALVTGRLSAGPFTAEFESAFARMHQRRHAAMCNSGTGALQLALQALKEAFTTDVEPILAMARHRAGGAIDPVGVFRASGYRERVARVRPAAARLGAGIV